METAGLSMGKRPTARSLGGFTLIELMLVMLIMAIGTTLSILALRDPSQAQLQGEASRLAGLLEGARAASRTQDAPLRWRIESAGFHFEGQASNPSGGPWPKDWLHQGIEAQVVNGSELVLGPEPVLTSQAVLLAHGHTPDQQVWVATDGVRPFAVHTARPIWLQ